MVAIFDKTGSQAHLHGLQHAEDNSVLAFYQMLVLGIKKGTLTVTGYMKTTAVVAGMTVPALAVTYSVTAAGKTGVLTLQSGTNLFIVPGPEAGAGLSFLVVASLCGLAALYRSRRASAL